MKWSDVGGLLKGAAPLLAKGLSMAGPGGAVVGSLVQSVLGTDNPDEAYAKLNGNPEMTLALRTLEMENQTQLAHIALAEEQARIGDVQDARNRNLERLRLTGKRDVHLLAMEWFIFISYAGLTAALTWKGLTSGIMDINPMVAAMWGTWTTAFVGLISYKWGSSQGSKDKSAVEK